MFVQAWVIVARINPCISVPCAFYRLPDKNEKSYTAALEAIKGKDVGAPCKIHVDFERAKINAIREVYPDSEIVTCQVHWQMALSKNLTEHGLITFYNKAIEAQVFFRKLWALAYVPEEDVMDVWDDVVSNLPEVDEALETQEEEFSSKCRKYLL